jgi:hypothetical protein
MRLSKSISFLLALFLSCGVRAAVAPADPAGAASREGLRAAYQQVAGRLAKSPFGQPLHLEAEESERLLKGHAYALLPQSFGDASKALSDAAQWCDILLLPFNTKHCEASTTAPDRLALAIFVGRKYSTPLEKTHRLDFTFQVTARTAEYLQVVLTAAQGPFGTRDYRIVLELSPAEGGRSFLHLGYSYGYGTLARTAMQAYLSTIGAHKVGFTTEGKDEAGRPLPVRGMRGVMERNTMRYYLAIDAYLRSLGAAEAERPARMIATWFESVERYPRQLHELERGEYVEMKRAEFARMRSGLSPARRTASSSP